MLSGVIFDFNGTLAHLARWGALHSEVLARHDLPPEVIDRWGDGWLTAPADGECHEQHSSSPEAYHRWELDRLRVRARACGVPEPRVEVLVADLDRETKDIVMTSYADVPAALARLRERGLTVAVCSNWYWDLDTAVAQAGLTDLVDTLVTSARVGMRKPDPRIYRHTLDRCGLGPDEVLFVGDMWGPDVTGPRAVGMRAAHLWRAERRGEPPACGAGTWRVPDMPAVVDLVDALSAPAGPGRCG